MACNPRHAVVRSSWLFGFGGENIVDAVLAAAEVSTASPSTSTRKLSDVHGAPRRRGRTPRPAASSRHLSPGGPGRVLEARAGRHVLQVAGSRALASRDGVPSPSHDRHPELCHCAPRAPTPRCSHWQTGDHEGYLDSRAQQPKLTRGGTAHPRAGASLGPFRWPAVRPGRRETTPRRRDSPRACLTKYRLNESPARRSTPGRPASHQTTCSCRARREHELSSTGRACG